MDESSYTPHIRLRPKPFRTSEAFFLKLARVHSDVSVQRVDIGHYPRRGVNASEKGADEVHHGVSLTLDTDEKVGINSLTHVVCGLSQIGETK